MGADLYIHIYEGLSEMDMRAFFGSTIWSKYDPVAKVLEQYEGCPGIEFFRSEVYDKQFNDALAESARLGAYYEENDLYAKFAGVPGVWVGEVSWLKAALLDAPDDYIPDPIDAVNEIMGEDLLIIDDELIQRVADAMSLDNDTGYNIADKESVVSFLREHKGKKAFTISW